jgi:hypothetical protein
VAPADPNGSPEQLRVTIVVVLQMHHILFDFLDSDFEMSKDL